MTSLKDVPPSRCWGMFTRRERWGLSWRGRGLVLLVLLGIGLGVFFRLYPFFAVSEPVETRLLAVEGWVNLYALKAAAEEFRARPYERLFTTGGPIHGTGGYTNDNNTAARVGAGRLIGLGMSPDEVQMVPSRVSARDRTYGSAVALRLWCEQNHVALTSINVVTEDVHARRTRLLYQLALGNSVKVGIIAVPNPDYDPKRWWRYSEGVRDVIGETIAYVYAKVFFMP